MQSKLAIVVCSLAAVRRTARFSEPRLNDDGEPQLNNIGNLQHLVDEDA